MVETLTPLGQTVNALHQQVGIVRKQGLKGHFGLFQGGTSAERQRFEHCPGLFGNGGVRLATSLAISLAIR